MREIKFRAWVKGDKVMADSITLNNTDLLGGDLSQLDPNLILMQYTGLKDKNGKEIYEGDIVKTDNIRGLAVWDEVRGGWSIMPNRTKEFEVIGNIYENKNLLK